MDVTLVSQALEWRRKFTSAFLQHQSYPGSEELPLYDALLRAISSAGLSGVDLKQSKLHVVFDQIGGLPTSCEAEVRFHDRVLEVFEQWKGVPDSPVQAYLDHKDQRLQRAERERITTVEIINEEAVLAFGRQRRTTAAPPLPTEILAQIFHNNLELYSAVHSEWNDHDNLLYLEERRTLLSCCLVERSWYSSAIHLLYLGRIHLYSTQSIRLLLRSIRENTQIAFEFRFLRVCGMPSGPDYAEAAKDLIPLCLRVQRLEGSSHALHFRKEISLPIFTELKELTVSDQIFRRLIPLLCRLPSLEALYISWLLGVDGHEGRPGAPLPNGLGASVAEAPPPFHLKTICLKQCRLSALQWKWLLGSSMSIEYARLQQVDDNSIEIGKIIGTRVKHLHFKGFADASEMGSQELADSVSLYTVLTTLHISGQMWPWTELLKNIQSSLDALHISYSNLGIQAVVHALSSGLWQKSLQSVVIHHWANSDWFYGIETAEVRDNRKSLEKACEELERWHCHDQTSGCDVFVGSSAFASSADYLVWMNIIGNRGAFSSHHAIHSLYEHTTTMRSPVSIIVITLSLLFTAFALPSTASSDADSYTSSGSLPERPVISVTHAQPVAHIMPLPLNPRFTESGDRRGLYDRFNQDVSGFNPDVYRRGVRARASSNNGDRSY
ncbi:hypothetical protein NM688_g1214 [Phlebia brevispora]|uniref:Uncharacterized protein n=1 Tax=Phlebia brevispora TaxID=194682 RepID=A0ACC1TCB1_9APHY|nr:hypothetical protein NM688_g1214 [Phlebia brevispora]